MIRYVFILILILYTIYIIYNNILFKIIMSISTSQRSNQTSNRFLKLSSRFLLQTDLTYFYSLLINNSSPLRFSPSLYRSSKTIIEKKIRSTTSNPRIILKTFLEMHYFSIGRSKNVETLSRSKGEFHRGLIV